MMRPACKGSKTGGGGRPLDDDDGSGGGGGGGGKGGGGLCLYINEGMLDENGMMSSDQRLHVCGKSL